MLQPYGRPRVWARLDLDSLRSLVFLTLVASSQATIYVVRTRDRAWASRPGRWLIAASVANLAAAVVFAGTGTLMAPLSAPVMAVVAATVLIGALAADLVKIPAFKALGLHRLWRPAT